MQRVFQAKEMASIKDQCGKSMFEKHRRLEGLKHGEELGTGGQRIIQDGIRERQEELCF